MSARHLHTGAPDIDNDASQSPDPSSQDPSAELSPAEVVPVKPVEVSTDKSERRIYGLVDKDAHHHHHHHRRRKSSKRKRKTSPLLAILLIAVFAGLCAGAVWLSSIGRSMSMGDESSSLKAALADTTEQAEIQNDGFYVLIVGSDAREGDTASRGDVLMLARVDPTQGQVTLISIPRDTMVSVAGAEGVQKINASYAFGGASNAVYTVSKFAGVPISHYVEVDFTGMKEVVDKLGGVWVNVPERVSNSKTESGYLEAGEQMLDGETALAFARERYTASGGDFGRAQAQRLIVEAIIKQVLRSNPAEMPSLISSLADSVKTDYSVPDIVGLAFQFLGKKTTIYQAACPSYALWQDGVSYVGTMYDEWRDMMRRVDAGLDPSDTSVAIPEPYASSEKLGAATNAQSPKDYQDLAANAMTTDAVAETDSVTSIETQAADSAG